MKATSVNAISNSVKLHFILEMLSTQTSQDTVKMIAKIIEDLFWIERKLLSVSLWIYIAAFLAISVSHENYTVW